jgi:phospholipase A-2-activating protein
VRLWKLTKPTPPTYDGTLTSHGTTFVNSLAYVPPSSTYPDGLIVSGGKDAIIELRQPGKPPQVHAEALLLGHQGNVCALDVSEDGGMIVSGSWDTEAKIWYIGKWEAAATLKGHQASVWAVLAYDKETVITGRCSTATTLRRCDFRATADLTIFFPKGCADRLIRVFNTNGTLTKEISGSSDVVRALCRLPPINDSGAQFASAGNDAIIRLWTLQGLQVAELHGHENFIYSLALSPSGELVSSSEDRTVRIWKGNTCVQTITHPAISVWSVAVCQENGDIVSGASDKIVRIFSRSKDRQADEAGIRAFKESVKASAIPQQSLGGVNKTDMPGPEFLTQKSGTKEGQVQMIKEANGNVSAYQWSTAANTWLNVGTVIDAAGATGGPKVSYNGKDYDYVFDVDIEDGKPPLKLPFNINQNPYEVARKFIEDNKLPITYLDQVTNFIVTNSQGATIGQSQAGPGSDPWGTESRYRPGDAGAATPAQQSAASRPKILPQTQYLTIVTANHKMILKKIEEFNRQLLNDGRKDISINPAGLEALAATMKQIELASSKPGAMNPASAEGIDAVLQVATRWPVEKRLPGLDMLRLLSATSENTVAHTSSGSQTLVDLLAETNVFSPESPINNTMLAVRALANLFNHSAGRTIAEGQFDMIHTLVEPFTTSPNRNMIVAIATLYINYSVLLSQAGEGFDANHALTLIATLSKIIETATDAEALYRALVGAGTLLALGKDFRSVAKEGFEFEKMLARAEKVGVEPRIKNVVREMRDELK